MSIVTAGELRTDIRAYLEGWFAKCRAFQESKGKAFRLSFDEYLQLWGKRRIRSLTKWMDEGSLYVRQRKHTKDNPNPNGYVLSPVSFAASREAECHSGNMMIATRAAALEACRMKKGDKHADHSRAKISEGTRGVPKSEAHKQKTSASMTGMVRGPMDDAGKKARSDSMKAHWAKKKAEKASQGE